MLRAMTFSRSWRSSGLTLLEVLAALTILATLLAGLLLAKGRALCQQALAQRQLEAIAAADELMEQWWAEGAPDFPSSGDVPQHPELQWRAYLLRPSKDSLSAAKPPYAIAAMDVAARSDQQILTQVQWFVPPVEQTSMPATTQPTRRQGGKQP